MYSQKHAVCFRQAIGFGNKKGFHIGATNSSCRRYRSLFCFKNILFIRNLHSPGGLQFVLPRVRLVLASALIRRVAAALKIPRRKKDVVLHGNYSHTLLKLFPGKKYVQKNAMQMRHSFSPNSFYWIFWHYRIRSYYCKIFFCLQNIFCLSRQLFYMVKAKKQYISINQVHYIYSLKHSGVSSKSSDIQTLPLSPQSSRSNFFTVCVRLQQIYNKR